MIISVSVVDTTVWNNLFAKLNYMCKIYSWETPRDADLTETFDVCSSTLIIMTWPRNLLYFIYLTLLFCLYYPIIEYVTRIQLIDEAWYALMYHELHENIVWEIFQRLSAKIFVSKIILTKFTHVFFHVANLSFYILSADAFNSLEI